MDAGLVAIIVAVITSILGPVALLILRVYLNRLAALERQVAELREENRALHTDLSAAYVQIKRLRNEIHVIRNRPHLPDP